MSRTKNPHVLFYMDGEMIDEAYHDCGPRTLALCKKGEWENRGQFADSATRSLIIYAGRLGEDLRYVETV